MRLETERLILRPFREDDLDVYHRDVTGDAEVMEYLEGVKSREETAAEIGRIRQHTRDGVGFLAVEIPGETSCAGFIGLMRPTWQAHFTPCVEVGWRLARRFWGRGYAVEGAKACVAHGFGTLQLEEIVALTVPANQRSQSVMRKLGMTRDPADDFDHPRVADGSPLKRHVLYRLKRS